MNCSRWFTGHLSYDYCDYAEPQNLSLNDSFSLETSEGGTMQGLKLADIVADNLVLPL